MLPEVSMTSTTSSGSSLNVHTPAAILYPFSIRVNESAGTSSPERESGTETVMAICGYSVISTSMISNP